MEELAKHNLEKLLGAPKGSLIERVNALANDTREEAKSLFERVQPCLTIRSLFGPMESDPQSQKPKELKKKQKGDLDH